MSDLISWKDGDIYRWSWNDLEYEKRKQHHDMYWCCSRIAKVKTVDNDTFLEDTYWSSSTSRSFTQEQVVEQLDVTYLGNINDYVKARKEDQAMYDDADFLNLNYHNTHGEYYTKVGAAKSKEKMVKIIKRNALKLQNDLDYAKRALQWELDKLNNLDELNYAYPLDGVSMDDVSYVDSELFKIESLGE